MSNLIEIRSEAQFQELVQKKDLVFILNFWAPWAEPCQQMNDVFAELSGKFPALQFLKV
jgi:thiol-disulfide isomerase/thioredoxin